VLIGSQSLGQGKNFGEDDGGRLLYGWVSHIQKMWDWKMQLPS